MKQRPENRSAVFFRAFAATMGIFGALLAAGFFLFLGSRPKVEVPPPVTTALPEAADRLTVLVLGRESGDDAPEVCVLFGFLPDKGTIAVCALPMATYWKAGGGEGTIAGAWEAGGAGYVRQQLALYFGIAIDRTLVMEEKGLGVMVLTCGTLPYPLREDLQGEVHGRRVEYPRGQYDADARTLADWMLLPGKNPAAQSDRVAELVRAMTEYHLPAVLTDAGEELFKNLVNNSSTDLAALDYVKRLGAARFLAVREGNTASCVYVDGTAGTEGYYLSEPTLLCIKGTYGAAAEESGG